jgi:hypothetical protein
MKRSYIIFLGGRNMPTSSLDKFFDRIAHGWESLLSGDAPPVPPAHWIVLVRGGALELDAAPDDGHHSQLVDSLIASGAQAAAHVAYLKNGDERLLTYAVVSDPLDSDVRTARIARPGAVVGGWEAAL